MFFDLLHLGDGKQALNYFFLCFFAILGALQLVAAKYHRRDLLWTNSAIGAFLIVASFMWFFVTDQEIFIPGLAGGELFTIFIVAFILATPITRALAWLVQSKRVTQLPREKEPTV